MSDYIFIYQGKSHEYIEHQIFKEYLFVEIEKLRKELKKEILKAEKGGVSQYIINIFTIKLEDRITHLNTIVTEVIDNINKLDNK